MQTRFVYDGEGELTEEDRDGKVTPGLRSTETKASSGARTRREDATTGVRDLVYEDVLLDGSQHELTHTQRYSATTRAKRICASPVKAGCVKNSDISPKSAAG